MQIARVFGDKSGMRELERVIENAHGPGEPTKIRLVANDDRIVSAFNHEPAQALDTSVGTRYISHNNSFPWKKQIINEMR